MKKLIVTSLFLMAAVLGLLTWLVLSVVGGDLPIPVTLGALHENSRHYDGVTVTAPCHVASIFIFDGRMGSKYAQITCAETLSVVGLEGNINKEFFGFNPGDDIVMQGAFHHTGWLGGVRHANFIDVEATFTDRRP